MKTLRQSLAILALALAACAGGQQETRTPPPAATTPAPAPKQAEKAPAATPPATPKVANTPDQAFRANQPKPLPVTPKFEAPVPVQRSLKNGLQVLVYENHALPLVSVDLMVKTGVDGEPANKAGLADFTASMLDEGTKTRSALQVAEAFEDVAAHYSAGAGLDATRLHLNSLSETLPQALDVFADVLLHPAFRLPDLNRVRKNTLGALEQKLASPGALAYDEMAKQLFGADHPWGKPSGGTPTSVKSFTSRDLARFHRAFYVPNNAVVSVVGDITPDQAVALLQKALGKWRAHRIPKLKFPPLPKQTTRHIVFVEKNEASQSQVWTGTRLPLKASAPEAIALRTGNFTLGGLFTSRLNLNLREAHGYSYGVFSRLGFDSQGASLVASGGIIAKNTVDAVHQYALELKKFSNGEVSQDELDAAKEAYIRSLPSVLETNDSVARAFNTLVDEGLPLDYYRTLPEKVGQVSLGDVAKAVQGYVNPDRWPIVVVGPAEYLEGLKKLGLGTVTTDNPEELPAQEKSGSSASRK